MKVPNDILGLFHAVLYRVMTYLDAKSALNFKCLS